MRRIEAPTNLRENMRRMEISQDLKEEEKPLRREASQDLRKRRETSAKRGLPGP